MKLIRWIQFRWFCYWNWICPKHRIEFTWGYDQCWCSECYTTADDSRAAKYKAKLLRFNVRNAPVD